MTEFEAGKWQVYASAAWDIADGIRALASTPRTPWKVALFTHRSNAGDTQGPAVYGDLTNEVESGNGYTTGGADTSGQWLARTIGSTKVITFTALDVEWDTIRRIQIAARYAAIYKDVTVDSIVKPLVCVCVLDTKTRGDLVAPSPAPDDYDYYKLAIEMNRQGVFTAMMPVEA